MFLGVDGCKGGWFSTIFNNNSWQVNLYKNLDSLWAKNKKAKLILIDMPVFLLNCGVRRCDKLARKLLDKKRKSSIFNAPSKKAMEASNYKEASLLNFRYTGKKLSKQTWNLIPKIREIDKVIKKYPGIIGIVKESHPELCFKSFSGRIKYSKKNVLGKEERLEILTNIDPDSKNIFDYSIKNFKRQDVLYDDILDSIILSITAKFGYGKLSRIPETPQYNELCQKAETVYFSKKALI